jgi:hypothetical protein
MTFFLEFRLNACPICLICLDCQNKYGQNCTCQARNVEWKRKKVERDYVVNFCQRPFTQDGATKQKVTLDKGFVDWVLANISPYIELSSPPNKVNICQDCMNGFRGKNKSINFLCSYLKYYMDIKKFILLKYI